MESNIFRLKNWFFFYKKLTLEIFFFFTGSKNYTKYLKNIIFQFTIYYLVAEALIEKWYKDSGINSLFCFLFTAEK